MLWNIALALVSVCAGYYLIKVRGMVMRILLVVAWILFVPNCLYLVTDIVHVIHQFGTISRATDVYLVLWYTIVISIGVYAHLWSMLFMISFMERQMRIASRDILQLGLLMQIAIGLGMMLGRVGRLNSWDVLTRPYIVITHTVSLLQEPIAFSLFVIYAAGSIGLFVIVYRRLVMHRSQAYHAVQSIHARHHVTRP
jgi:uncharacterized membrane protein